MIRASRQHDNGDRGACRSPAGCVRCIHGLAPSNDATELGDAFGSSGTAGNGATAPPAQTSDSSSQTVESTMGGGGCAVTVGRSLDHDREGFGFSDHWLSDQEIADARHDTSATQPISADGDTSPAAAGRRTVFSWLVISCGDLSGEGFSLLANAGASAGDVPFGPGTYSITPGFPQRQRGPQAVQCDRRHR